MSALAAAAGVEQPSCTTDPSLYRFQRRCEELGLRVQRHPVPQHVVQHVSTSQPVHERFVWWLSDTWERLILFTVSVGDAAREETGR